jgi:hypothetical protein
MKKTKVLKSIIFIYKNIKHIHNNNTQKEIIKNE